MLNTFHLLYFVMKMSDDQYDIRVSKIVNDMIRKYYNHKLQTTHGILRKSYTTITRHQEDKQSKPISSLPHQDDCKTRMDTK